MQGMNQEERNYQVVLVGIEGTTEEKKESFCKKISENFSISLPSLKKIVDRCPIVVKKNLSLIKAETLGKMLKSFGAIVSVEERKEVPAVFLEFKDRVPYRVALESSDLRRIQSGEWNLVGRARNISGESLNDTWVLVQTFNHFGDLLTYEEAPVPFNPIPPGEAFPFKVVFEGDLSVQRISVAFKNAQGYPEPAVDRRRKGGRLGIGIRDEKGEEPPFIDRIKPSEEPFLKDSSDIGEMEARPSEPESSPPLFEEKREVRGEDEGQVSGGTVSLMSEEVPRENILEPKENILEPKENILEPKENILEPKENTPEPKENIPAPKEETTDLTSGIPRQDGYQAEEELRGSLENDSSEMVPPNLPPPLFEASSHLSLEVSPKDMEEEKMPYPWLNDFRNAIEMYYQKHRDIFSIWFEAYQKDGGFAHPLHSILTILVHARFNQGNLSEKALENTQRVIRFITQSNLRLEEIPPLEGTPFFSGEDWRDLFHKAFPKLQQTANRISKEKWNAIDLERLIGVVPHMSDKNSRMAIRWMHELIPDIIQIDFSNIPVNIGDNLYRVASRLGVVNPNSDYYQGRNSIGDLKIQSFAKTIFPRYPIKIEEPMTWVGRKEEEGGYCLPTQPRCEGCHFEPFCPRLYLTLNPSGKGIRER